MRLGNGRLRAGSRLACYSQQSGTDAASKESTTTFPPGAAVRAVLPISLRIESKLLVIAVWTDAAVEGLAPSFREPPEIPTNVVYGPPVTRPALASRWNRTFQLL